jgi:hypothetical protein
LDIIALLDQAISHSEELHGITITCMTQGVALAGFPMNGLYLFEIDLKEEN